MQVNRFTVVASVLATAGAVLAIVALPALGAEDPYLASAGVGAGLGTIFAGYNLYATLGLAHHRLAPSLMATLLGVWLLLSPSVVEIGDGSAVIAVQFGGTLLAVFAGYTAIESIEPSP